MRRPSPRRWSSGAMPSSPAGRTPDRKSTRLNSSHLVISYAVLLDRKSTRLNSSHLVISYAVFCLKKKIDLLRRLPALESFDDLPLVGCQVRALQEFRPCPPRYPQRLHAPPPRDPDRKSTRLNSSHLVISYAVFCLKKKKTRGHVR